MKRIMIVDAYNQFIRGYIVDPSKNPNGQPIGGMRTFTNILNKITREINPDMIAVVWDGKGGSKKRRAINKGYKAGRKPPRTNWSQVGLGESDIKDNKVWQQMRVIEYLNQTPIVQFMEPEIEADDVIAYIKNSPMFEEWQKVIVSADKDFIQLLDEKTLLFRPIQKEVLSAISVVEKFGIHPRNFALARAIAGDPSDNLPGVPRIGLGTVAKRFPFLKSDKDYYIEDLLKKSETSENSKLKVYQSVVSFEGVIRENYDIMQLAMPKMSVQSKSRVDETFSGFAPAYNQSEMRKLMIQDGVLTVNVQDLEQKFNHIINCFSTGKQYN